MKRRLILIYIGLSIISQPGVSMEKWYSPVGIGEHIDYSFIIEEELSKDRVIEIFQKGTFLRKGAYKKYEKIKERWLEENGADYLKKYNNKNFSIDKEGHHISATVYKFSKLKAKIDIKFIYGYSRWHHYYIVLGSFIAERDPYLDEVFNLIEIEKKYSYSFKGVSHGLPAEDVVEILGNNYYEYAGQSPQYRKIYYEQYNIEIIIQDRRVKYLQKGKPGWMDTEMKLKR